MAALLLSAATHLSLTLLGDPRAADATASSSAPRIDLVDVDVELPSLSAPPGADTDDPTLLGGASTPRPDTGRAGRGGDDEVAAPAVNLAPRDDQAHLAPELRSRIDRAQEARTRSGRERRSPEDDRVSPRPMILTFVADGEAVRAIPPATRALTGRHDRDEQPSGAGIPHLGGAGARLWGVDGARGTGEGHEPRSAKAVHGMPGALAHDNPNARPMTVRGDESSPSNERGSQQDDTDAEQEVVAPDTSPLRASTAGGREGVGRGGTEGGGRPGAGANQGTGSRAQAFGSGGGTGVGIDPADARRRMYLRWMWARIHGSWSANDFPKQAALDGKQGHTIVSFTVMPDGNVTNVRVTRPSGFPDFDRKMVRAVMRAAPFGPLPAELGPVLHRTHEFIVSNPAVRPPHR